MMTAERRTLSDGSSWPLPDAELQWRLRYGGAVSRTDALAAAAILDAYAELVKVPESKRRLVVRELKNTPERRNAE